MSEPHVAHTKSLNITQNLTESRGRLASNTGVFRGARLSSLPTRDETRAPLKTPAWEASGRGIVTWKYLFLITVQSASDWILYWMPKRDLLISEAYAQLGAGQVFCEMEWLHVQWFYKVSSSCMTPWNVPRHQCHIVPLVSVVSKCSKCGICSTC